MKRFLPALGLASWLLIPGLSGNARANELRFALSNWNPFSFHEDGNFDGIDLDVAREIAKRVGFKLHIRPCTFKRCLKEMELGLLDMQSGIARDPKREVYMDYVKTPYSAVSVVFHVRKGEAGRLVHYEDLYNLRVGAVVSSHYFDSFNKDTKLQKFEVTSEGLLLPMLAAGRIDAYVGTNPNAAYDILKRGYKERIELAKYSPGEEVPIYFAISRKSKYLNLIPSIDRAIQAIHNDGTMEKIMDEYR